LFSLGGYLQEPFIASEAPRREDVYSACELEVYERKIEAVRCGDTALHCMRISSTSEREVRDRKTSDGMEGERMDPRAQKVFGPDVARHIGWCASLPLAGRFAPAVVDWIPAIIM